MFPKKVFDGKGFKIDVPGGSITIYFENLEKWRVGGYTECRALYRPDSAEWKQRRNAESGK